MFLNNFLVRIDFVRLFLYYFTLPTVLVHTSTVLQEYGEFKLFKTPVTYDLNTSVSITDENEGGKTIGYRITAVVGVEPIWSDQETDFLLKFHLESPKLHIVGVKGEVPAPSSWDAVGHSPFYARLTHGAVQAAYLDERDPLDLLNYKKSIISLFQFRAIDGESKETDVSGLCDVIYQSTSLTTIHKTKVRCGEDEPETWERRATYSLSGDLSALSGVRVRERAWLRAGPAALSARALLALQLRPAPRAPDAPPAPLLDAALQDIPAHLKPTPLTLHSDPEKWEWEEEEELHSALSEMRALAAEGAGEEGAGAGGDERGARAALRALRALAAAPAAAVRNLLADDAYYPVLPSLYRLVGQSGSGAALAAAISHLQLAAGDAPRAPAQQLLAGAARAARPDAAARAALLALARGARAPHVADAALLAAAAQARRAPRDARPQVRDLVTRELARCKDDPCRIVRLHALGNLGLPDTAETLLSHAARGTCSVALSALDALEMLDPLEPKTLSALQDIAEGGGRPLEVRAAALQLLLRRAAGASTSCDHLQDIAEGGGRPLEVRAAALQLLLRRAAGASTSCDHLQDIAEGGGRPLEVRAAALQLLLRRAAGALPPLAAGLRRAPHELRRVLWQTAQQLADEDEHAARLLRELPLQDRHWHARANKGTSSVLSRATGWALEAGQARLHSAQVAARGALRRGVVALRLHAAGDARGHELLAVELWARGLEGLAAAGGEGADLDEGERADAAQGGLRLRVDGVHAPGVMLFDGQAELLGHVWAGAGSSATPVLRGARARAARARGPLAAGARLACRADHVNTFAVDAQAQVSLWSRSARAALELRAAAASEAACGLRVPGGGRLAVTARAGAAPRLALDAHLDFYDGVTLCVRPALPAHRAHRNLTTHARTHTHARARTHTRAATWTLAGRTLSLGGDNDRACRHIAAEDHP